jgi:cytidine deaminase
MSDFDMQTLDEEDVKLVVLARASRARTGAIEGAAVRDTDGRTYAAASVTIPSLKLTALQAAVVMAVSSGSSQLEAAAVVSEAIVVDGDSVAAVRDLAPHAFIYVADVTGEVHSALSQDV